LPKSFKKVGSSVPAATPEPAKGQRPDPAMILALTAQQAPTLPPTRIVAVEPIGQLNLKVKAHLIDQLADRAAAEGTSQKAIVCKALAAFGFEVHEDDLVDRTNHRRKGRARA
jgi:hypothetical protein